MDVTTEKEPVYLPEHAAQSKLADYGLSYTDAMQLLADVRKSGIYLEGAPWGNQLLVLHRDRDDTYSVTLIEFQHVTIA